MTALFVAGTDTGVGKTVVTGLLGRTLRQAGCRVTTQKWVQTGEDLDIATHRRLIEEQGTIDPRRQPCRFTLPASPHLAAAAEKRRIDPARIESSLRALEKQFDLVLVEGAGGLLVPYSRRLLQIDLVAQFELPVLLVAANRLGAINQTLLSLEALAARKLRVVGVVFNQTDIEENAAITADNPKSVAGFSSASVLGILPCGKLDHVVDSFRRQKIANAVLRALAR